MLAGGGVSCPTQPIMPAGTTCEAELPDAILEASHTQTLRVLSVRCDQEQVHHAALQHLCAAQREGGMGAFRCATHDCYYRTWSELRWACTQSKGGLSPTYRRLL